MKPEQNSNTTLKGMNIGCYDGLSKEIYAQEGINYEIRHQELSANNLRKITHPEEFQASQNNPIPLISHRIHLFSPKTPKDMDDISINKTSVTINGLNDASAEWQHFLWTNNPAILPETITSLKNIVIKEIEGFQENILWNHLDNLLQESETNQRSLSGASDLIRYISLYQYGGVYFDTDYHLVSPEMLMPLLKTYNFIGGKEFDKEMSYMGNSFIASAPTHPIIETAISQIYRNLNSEITSLPLYLQYPCSKFNTRMYSTGPALITLAFYKSANINGNNDLLAMNGNIFFNQNYVQYITPNTPCSKPDKPTDFINNINGTLVKTIGADYWCHPWPSEYFDYIYYPNLLDTYLFGATLSNSTERVKTYINAGANPNQPYHGFTPLSTALKKQNIEAVKLLVNANATVTDDMKLKAQAEGNDALLQALHKNSKIATISCYANEMEDIFAQEGFNYHQENRNLIQHYKEIIQEVEHYINVNQNPIPLKTHQVYVTSTNSPKPIENISLNNTISTLKLLNEASDKWQHFIWTNNPNIIPESIRTLSNVTIRMIDEFSQHPLWNNIQNILEEAKTKKYFYAMAADIIRILALNVEGGIYRDLDNKIHPDPNPEQKLSRVETLMQWLKAFNFIGGREHNKDLSFIGNAFMASVPNHPILNTTLGLIDRNINSKTVLLPEYMQYPCNVGVKVIYDTGSPTLTSAYFKTANKNGNIDIIFPTNIFFNVEYARYIAPESRCHHLVKEAKLDNEINGELIKSIASDPNCGSWQSLDPIEYPHSKNFKLYNAAASGNVKLLTDLLAQNNSDINALHNNKVNPLGIAAYNGHYEIVQKLLEAKADTEILSNGYTPLYWAIQNGYYNIATSLVYARANVNAKQANNASILYLASTRKAGEIIKLLLGFGANPDIGYQNYTPEGYAKNNNFTEISKIFLDHKLYRAAESGNDQEVIKLITLGADVNSLHLYNTTPLYIAARRNHPSTVKLLLQKGANIDAKTANNSTALYASASDGYTEVTQILLENGADTEILTGQFTPLVAAAHFERIEDVNLLLKYGAKVISDEAYTAFNVAQHKQKKTEAGEIIYKNILDHYLNSKDLIEPSFEVVIARYNENLDWAIKEFGLNTKVIVYNKGPNDLNLPKNFEVIELENTGREAHTYFHHIIENYDHLSDIVLFLQGHPYEHPLFLPLKKYKDFLATKCSNIMAKCTKAHPTLSDKSKDLESQLQERFKNYKAKYTLIEFVHQFIEPDFNPDSNIYTINGAQFAVKKENILSHPIQYYEKLISVLLNNINPLEGFYYERIWDLVFAPGKPIKDYDIPLFYAAIAGNLTEVNNLINLGANINKQFKDGVTSLHAAISRNHTEVVESLIEKGADVNLALHNKASPLFMAVHHNNLGAAKLLIDSGANINDALLGNGYTPLHKAIQTHNRDMIKLLIDSGAKFYSDLYMDPLSLSARLELFDVHSLLLDKYLAEFTETESQISQCNAENIDQEFEVVIVRYNEDLAWLPKEFPCDKVTVYNKGTDKLDLLPYHTEIDVPNIGYYEGSILNHIVENYNHLPNRLLFVQANPYDAYIYLPLSLFKGSLSSTCKNIIGKCEPGHNLLRESKAMQNFDWENGVRGKYKNFNYQDNDLWSFANFYLDSDISQSFSICYAGLFAVNKDVILRHPVEYYQNLANSINYSKYPIEAFYIERLWDFIFAPPLDQSKNYCDIELPW